VKFVVSRSDVTVEAAYQQPEFALFGNESRVLGRLVDRLSPYGLRFAEMKIERGNGSLGDLHLLCHLLDYLLTVRIRLDRTEVVCSLLTTDNKRRVMAAIVDTFACVREHVGGQYRAYAMSLNIHGLLENQSAKSFLNGLIAMPPPGAGQVVGNAVAYYFSPADERIASSLTFDVSALTAEGLYARPQATWDAGRLPLEELAAKAEGFVRDTMGAFGIEVPQ
jgi:hypothetical protein